MKKVLLFLSLILFACPASLAACEYHCAQPYNMNSKFRAFMSSASGINFVSEKAAESAIKKAITKKAENENLRVKIDSFSSKDLKNGIFKSIKVEGENLHLNDIYLSSLKMNTLCDFNYVQQSGKDILFKEELPMSFDMEFSPSDINKTMKSEKYQRIIKDLNKLGSSYGGGLKISTTKVEIKSGKFQYIIGIAIPFIKSEQKIIISSDLMVKKGKIDFKNTHIVSKAFHLDLKKTDFILNYLNPLDFSVNILENKDARVSVNNVKIKNDRIVTDGVVVIPKD